MALNTTALRNGAGEFLGWWFGELAAIVPARVRNAVRPADRTVSVTLEAAHVSLTKTEGGIAEPLGRFPAPEGVYDAAPSELARIVSSYRAPRWRWGLHLDDSMVLRDLFRLPAAAIENHREAVEFQIERQTPFRRGEVYFDCRPLSGAATNLVGVEVVMARRDMVDTAVQRVTAMGIPVDFVTAGFDRGSGHEPFDLLHATVSPRHHGRGGLNAALAGLALLLGGILVYLPMDRDRQLSAALSARVDQLRTEAQVAARLREQIETERRNLLSVVRNKQEARAFTQILDDLTRLLPDSAWVSRLDFRDGTIRVVMYAPESGSIIRLIESSRHFSGAKMVTAVRQQAGTGHEQFTLSFSAIKEGQR